ncbi:MAG: hypothetical protein HY757_10285 [Nitrospirae bacterium]|nr:hypothetical protein [Nitrospirota bacterium]
MQIDAREFESHDSLKKLKEILSSNRECNLSIDILVKSVSDAKKITGFVSMSGCTAQIDKKENFCIIHVRGIPCCT